MTYPKFAICWPAKIKCTLCEKHFKTNKGVYWIMNLGVICLKCGDKQKSKNFITGEPIRSLKSIHNDS